jgi:myo-inositol-1(or 4)-monophosphatase
MCRLKPWDVCAGVLMVQEAGGKVTTMKGDKYSVFEQSVMASNGALHAAIQGETKPATERLLEQGVDLSRWFVPNGYQVVEE